MAKENKEKESIKQEEVPSAISWMKDKQKTAEKAKGK